MVRLALIFSPDYHMVSMETRAAQVGFRKWIRNSSRWGFGSLNWISSAQICTRSACGLSVITVVEQRHRKIFFCLGGQLSHKHISMKATFFKPIIWILLKPRQGGGCPWFLCPCRVSSTVLFWEPLIMQSLHACTCMQQGWSDWVKLMWLVKPM